MFKSIMDGTRGVFSILLYYHQHVFWCTAIFIVACSSCCCPSNRFRRLCRKILTAIANCWIGVNNLNQRLFNGIRWDVQGLDNLDPQRLVHGGGQPSIPGWTFWCSRMSSTARSRS